MKGFVLNNQKDIVRRTRDIPHMEINLPNREKSCVSNSSNNNHNHIAQKATIATATATTSGNQYTPLTSLHESLRRLQALKGEDNILVLSLNMWNASFKQTVAANF
eukprot:1378376-Amphidinium_carterae.1